MRRLPLILVSIAAIGMPGTGEARGARGAGNAATPAQEADSAHIVESTEELNLAVGENKTVRAVDVKNYSEGIGGVAEIKLTTDGTQFVIVGTKPGTTTLLLIKKDGSQVTWVINVFARSPQAVEREVQLLLEGTTGVRVRRVGSRFFIEGGVNTDADAKRIQQIATLFPGQVESLVVVGSGAAERKLNIRVDFFFVQYDRTSSYQFGVNWPSRIGGTPEIVQSNFGFDFLSGVTTSAQASVVNQPLPGLDVASRNGWAKVLKQSTVITTNGSEATFDSGGEQNFPINNGLSSAIHRISFGTNVTILPRFDPKTSDLEVKVDADISDLSPSLSSSPLPGRNLSKLTTIVHMKLGQSLVLSGIRTRAQRRTMSGLPMLSEIPILGLLFGSQSNANEELEGAVFVIPSVVDAAPKNALELVQSAMSQYREYSGDIDAINAYNKRPDTQASPEPEKPRKR